jgi:hypothetical protein
VKEIAVEAPRSDNVRKAIWLMLVEPEFRRELHSGEAKAAASRHGIELTDEDVAQLQQLDPDDLDELLERVDRDVVLVMGGSRPRPSDDISLGVVRELRKLIDQIERGR